MTTATERANRYAWAIVLLAVIGIVCVWFANLMLAPALYHGPTVQKVGEVLASGRNYANYDLNIHSRGIKHALIMGLDETPDVAVLGASHWQEGHVSLIPDRNFFNAHVHRDYYEDMPAMVQMFLEADRLPKQLIITIRDNLFTPVAERTDFLWTPGIPFYREMAPKLGLEPHPWHTTAQWPQLRELTSITMLRTNIWRALTEPVHPHPTTEKKLDTLDLLLPGGSIIWSRKHDALFTAERSRQEALSFAAHKRVNPPMIDPIGVETFDRLLQFLQARGVEIYLAHPPFNPIYWDAVQDSPYIKGLERVKNLTKDYARRYGLQIVGSFNPYEVGCSAEQYIDAEHSDPECLANILNQYVELDRAKKLAAAQ